MKHSTLSHDEQLMRMARNIAKLETKARSLRAQLKLVVKDLKAEKKTLRAYAQSLADHELQSLQGPPMRLFGEKV